MGKIYLYSGKESVIIQNKVSQLIKQYAPHTQAHKTYDLENDTDFKGLKEALYDARVISILEENKIIIIKNPGFLNKGLPKDLEIDFIKYLEKPFVSTVLIIRVDQMELNKQSPLVKKLYEVAEVIDTQELTDVQLSGWIQRQFEVDKIAIEKQAIALFAARVGKNLEKAKTEIAKLKNYVGSQKLITVDDVKDIVTRGLESDVFSLIKVLFEKKWQDVTRIYQDLVLSGITPGQIFGTIASTLTDLIVVKLMIVEGYNQERISKHLNKSSGRIFYLMKDASKFEYSELKEKVQELADLDVRIKSGLLDQLPGLEIFLFSSK